jgi:hypothetical protein
MLVVVRRRVVILIAKSIENAAIESSWRQIFTSLFPVFLLSRNPS